MAKTTKTTSNDNLEERGVKALESINVPYRIVVEPLEYELYAAVIDPSKILILPEDNMKLIGSRNWIKEHSIKEGHARHWQLDDNIEQFNRKQLTAKVAEMINKITR